jgi:hypothetical protein
MDLQDKIELIEKLSKSGYFSPLAIKILVEIAFSFDDLSYQDFVEVIKGGHVVIRNDNTDFWFKWKKMALAEGSCVNSIDKFVYDIDKGSCKKLSQHRNHKRKTQWKGYHAKRASSHPSVPVYNKSNTKYGDTFSSGVSNSVDQYEVNLGYNLKNSLFCLLVGSYEFRGSDNIPTQDHSGVMGDPNNFDYNERHLKNDRKYKVTWFQFEQYSATKGGIASSVLHVGDWLKYKLKQKNIGPFGESIYTEKPWNPLYINYNPFDLHESDYLLKKFQNLSSGKMTIGNISKQISKGICFNNTSHYGMYDVIKSKQHCKPFSFQFNDSNKLIITDIRPKTRKTYREKKINLRPSNPTRGRGKLSYSRNTQSSHTKQRTISRTDTHGSKKKERFQKKKIKKKH